ncbi:MAG: ethanolamine ammonia-lyase reactivating factor EutA [Candidatus Hermodarchaeota archaeon]
MSTLQRKWITSVGIDVGTATTHLIFSKLLLAQDPRSRHPKFEIQDRKIIYRGKIHFTPLFNPETIDFDKLSIILREEYTRAGLKTEEIDTGAVIVTGEIAKKHNAEQIVNLLARESGDFVSATAGPNFESIIACRGSGALDRSQTLKRSIMNIDIGGGSSNIAIAASGEIRETCAISVGGRLIAYNDDFLVTRVEKPANWVALDTLGKEFSVGDPITPQEIGAISNALSGCLFECVTNGQALSPLTQKLMMTEPLPHQVPIDEITFSGGVAEYIYGLSTINFNDLALSLAQSIQTQFSVLNIPLEKPSETIRATCIGAGQFTLKVSGTTTFLSKTVNYPLRNLPVIIPQVKRQQLSVDHVKMAIRDALKRFDLKEGEDMLVFYFKDPVRTAYSKLTIFARGVVAALPKTLEKNKDMPIILVFDTDIGNSVGNVMKRETPAQNILSIDEIPLTEGDFIDIGEPMLEGKIVPVVVKSLVFSK